MLLFPEVVRKNKDLGVMASREPGRVHLSCFPPKENARLWWKMLSFPDKVPKNKKPKDLGVCGKQKREESKMFFGTPSGKCKVLVENVVIS